MSERIGLNHWFVDENRLSISLMRFYVDIKISHNEKSIFYKLQVYFDSKVVLNENFNSLEDAVVFTETIVNKCYDVGELIEAYLTEFNDGEFKENKTDKQLKVKVLKK